MNATDHKYLSLLEDNNKLFARIAESLETIALHLLEQSRTHHTTENTKPIVHKPVFTYPKNNPFHYLKTPEAATELVKRWITLSQESGDKVASIRTLAKLIRHEYVIPEEQLLDLSVLQTTFKVCGLSQVSKYMWLINEPTTTPSHHKATL